MSQERFIGNINFRETNCLQVSQKKDLPNIKVCYVIIIYYNRLKKSKSKKVKLNSQRRENLKILNKILFQIRKSVQIKHQ